MEPFKELMNAEVVETLGDIVARVWPEFDQKKYFRIATSSIVDLELKERVFQVRDAFDQTLPADFTVASEILIASLHPSEDTDRDDISFGLDGACGFAVWPLTEFIALRAQAHPHPAAALAALKEMTKRFSAEFAVRPFLTLHQAEALSIFKNWTEDENRHVRRLASEGSRPRLPWGMRLQNFVEDPRPLLPILDALKDDPEEYVRRSVANNLNDIAKDHPDLVVATARDWMKGASGNRKRLVKHACRTLIKQGNADALEVFGYMPVSAAKASIVIREPRVVFGNELVFDFDLEGVPEGSNLMLDYAIHFVKSNGSRAPKVFKWKEMRNLQNGALSATRRHGIRQITTRKYYPGRHMIEVIVNGAPVAEAEFDLLMT